MGYGIKDYKDSMLAMETGEEMYERYIDPRLGAARYQGAEGASSIIDDLAENDIECIPAQGLDIEDGLQAIMSLMAYDTRKPVDSVNRPRFYITEDCENTIKALSEYTGEQGLKEAWKDPIDCLRYMAVSDLDYYDETNRQTTTTGAGGY